MHRKAEDEAASGANGDDDNAARRRLGPSDAAQYLQTRPLGQREAAAGLDDPCRQID